MLPSIHNFLIVRFYESKCLPAAGVNVAFQSSANTTLNTMLQPDVSKQTVVPFLLEEQLVVSAQCRIRFAMLVQVRRVGPAAVVAVQEEDHTLAHVDEQSYGAATGAHVLVATSFTCGFVAAAAGLAAENGAAEETERWI